MVLIVIVVVSVGKNNIRIKNNNIKIAALLSLTGPASAWGENAQKGIELAVEAVNKDGGIDGRRVDVIYEDTVGDPKIAVSAFKKVTTIDKVDAIIGPLNQTEIQSILPLIEQENTPIISPGFIPLKERRNIFNPIFVWTDAGSEAEQLADYVYKQGVTKVGVIGTIDAWEQTVTDAFVHKFNELGGEVTALEIVQPTLNDMKLSITKILNTKPQAIYLGTYYQFVKSLKEINTQGYKGKLFGIEIDNYLATETSVWSNGLQFIAPNYYNEDFISNFKNKNNVEPGIPAGQAYDSAKIMMSFFKGGKDKKEVLNLMKKFKEYDGVSGKLIISQDGRSLLPTAIFQIDGGVIRRKN